MSGLTATRRASPCSVCQGRAYLLLPEKVALAWIPAFRQEGAGE